MGLRNSPEIKVCGLTVPDEARACADLGADAIGLVFYPRSPRNVTLDQAAAIKAVLPGSVRAVGVFVDTDFDGILRTIAASGLDAIQLHGAESPEFVARLKQATEHPIIKALFATRAPGFNAAGNYPVSRLLVECGRGPLPGGNAIAWDWGAAKSMAQHNILILAGGLSPDTVGEAIAASLPDAVDASSALEAQAGRKDLTKVERFIAAVKHSQVNYKASSRRIRPVFSS